MTSHRDASSLPGIASIDDAIEVADTSVIERPVLRLPRPSVKKLAISLSRLAYMLDMIERLPRTVRIHPRRDLTIYQ